MKIVYAETVQTAFHTLRIAELGSDWEDMAMSGQNNGLCGSAIPGTIHLYCGPHTGKVSLQILVTHRPPSVDGAWGEIVESSFEALEHLELHVLNFDGDAQGPAIYIPEGTYRLRYSVLDFQDAEGPAQRYELIFWRSPLAPDAVLKVTSPQAAARHHPQLSLN